VAVVPETPPSFVTGYLKAVFQSLFGLRYPNHHTTDEYRNEDQRSDTDNSFTHGLVSFLGRDIHQPAMKFAHGLKERIAFVPSVYLAGVRVYA
jgi:hypothetical protein